MDITKTIADNLTRLMAASEREKVKLTTLKALAEKSKVGFGTVQRAKNGDGNITVQNLELLARAFGRSAIDLITESGSATYLPRQESPRIGVQDSASGMIYAIPERRAIDNPIVAEVVSLITAMDDIGKGMILERARTISEERAAQSKANAGRSFS